MKKFFVLLSVVASLLVVSSCKEKRCECTYVRPGYRNSVALEPLGSHANCSELDDQWVANDSTQEMLIKTCVEYVE